MITAKDVRKFFTDLFGSRVVAYLEMENLRIRDDFERRLQDKDTVIAELRAERILLQVKITTYENTIMPLASRAGAQIVASTQPKPTKPTFSSEEWLSTLPKSRWEITQEEHSKRVEEEIAEEERKKTAEQVA